MYNYPLFFNYFQKYPSFAKIIEVSPRDGLQNEKKILSIANKLRLIRKLEYSGLTNIEVGSIVNPKLVPQMSGSDDLIRFLKNKETNYSILIPNIKAYQKVMYQPNIYNNKCQVDEIVLFTAASETFNKKNINCSIQESFEKFKPIVEQAKKDKVKIRASISCCLGCPYEGNVPTAKVVDIINRFYEMGVDTVDIADTIGVGTAKQMNDILIQSLKTVPTNFLSGHFHDTNNTALRLVEICLSNGINSFHSSIGGLGGCPFSPTRAGNLQTEKLVSYLHEHCITTGIDLTSLKQTSEWIRNIVK